MTKKTPLSVTIRGQEADDWEDVAAILSCPNVIYNTFQLPFMSRDAIQDRLENPPADLRALVAVVNDHVVGCLSLRIGTGRRAHTAQLGMMVHADFQGRGVGTALLGAAVNLAENWLNISRIELGVFPDNAAAIALYEKFGFESEGVLRDAAYRDGQFADTILMSRIRGDEST